MSHPTLLSYTVSVKRHANDVNNGVSATVNAFDEVKGFRKALSLLGQDVRSEGMSAKIVCNGPSDIRKVKFISWAKIQMDGWKGHLPSLRDSIRKEGFAWKIYKMANPKSGPGVKKGDIRIMYADTWDEKKNAMEFRSIVLKGEQQYPLSNWSLIINQHELDWFLQSHLKIVESVWMGYPLVYRIKVMLACFGPERVFPENESSPSFPICGLTVNSHEHYQY